MKFDYSDDQAMIAETFARFLDEHSSIARVRAALPGGFDPELWRGLAELGAFLMRVPEAAGGTGLGLFDAALFMEQAGRTLASGPVAEALVAAPVLAAAGETALLEEVASGGKIVTIALHDAAGWPLQYVAGGAVADHVLVLDAGGVFLVTPTAEEKHATANLGFTPMAELRLDAGAERRALQGAGEAFAVAVEEWKLLTAAALGGLAREAIRLAAVYATERVQFGQPIGTYQGISFTLADSYVEVEGGKFFVWKTIRDLADRTRDAGAEISLACWWAATAAGRAVSHALHTFGGYGLTTEYDIHLYNVRAKAWPLVWGDPALMLDEGARRLYAAETAALPEAGDVSIDFSHGEEADALAREVDRFFSDTLTPELRAKAHYSFAGHDPFVHKKLAEAGLLFPTWPTEFGGRGASAYAASAASAVWEDHNWTGHAAGTTQMVGAMIRRFGTDELKQEVLTRIVAGDAICSLGFSEPSSGSDVFSAKTRATPEGKGWRIDGSKMFTSGADIADYVLMLTRTDPDAAKHRGLTMFIVPLKVKGVEVQPVHTFQGEQTNITFYDGVHIPDSYRLGEVNAGAKVMASALEMEHGASWIRTQHHMLHAAEAFCRETRRAGRPMIEDQAVMARLARVFAANAVTEVIGYHSLWSAAERKPNQAQGSMVKLFSSERFRIDSADLLDLTAPESLVDAGPHAAYLNLSYRHAQGTTIYGGTSEVHRSQVAERALNLPRTRA